MRSRALLVALPLLLLAAACGDEGDGGIAETEETTTSTTEDASPETSTETEDPADDAPQGRTACNAIPEDGSGAGPEELRAIAEEAPDDVAMALEDLLAAVDAGDPSGVDDAEDALSEVCSRYGVDL